MQKNTMSFLKRLNYAILALDSDKNNLKLDLLRLISLEEVTVYVSLLYQVLEQ